MVAQPARSAEAACSEAQYEFIVSDAPNVVFQAGAGAGKTWAGVCKALLNARRSPGSRGMFVAPSFPQLQQAVMPHLLTLGGDMGLLTLWDWQKQQNRIVLPNGSEFWLRSADNPAALLGADLAWCVGDEVALWKRQAYDYLMGRLRQPGYPHQAAFTFTPKGRNWCWEVLGVEREGLEIIRASTFTNPFLEDDYHERLRREYGEGTQLWQQEVLGEYVAWEGLVYPQFGVDTHIIEPPADIVTAVGGVDWGWTNPGVMLVLGVAADGTFHVLHETYEREQPIEWWAAEAQRLTARYGVSEWHCDPSEPGNIRALKVAGVEAVAANNAVVPGIAAVSARIASRELLLAPQCVETVRELQAYCWKTRPDGTQRKDEPEKHNDHAMDALRYAVMALTVVKRRGYVRSW
ncbi:MAG: hypothetical protein GX338_11850 [Firmicutes bacterium]|nr:hypothetical protein [Bacillota bacterium]